MEAMSVCNACAVCRLSFSESRSSGLTPIVGSAASAMSFVSSLNRLVVSILCASRSAISFPPPSSAVSCGCILFLFRLFRLVFCPSFVFGFGSVFFLFRFRFRFIQMVPCGFRSWMTIHRTKNRAKNNRGAGGGKGGDVNLNHPVAVTPAPGSTSINQWVSSCFFLKRRKHLNQRTVMQSARKPNQQNIVEAETPP